MKSLTSWDSQSRTVTIYDDAGTVTSTRPYTAAENAAADAAIADAATLTDLAARVARTARPDHARRPDHRRLGGHLA